MIRKMNIHPSWLNDNRKRASSSGRNDDGVPAPNKDQLPIDQAFNSVVRQCRDQGRSYFGDVVREQLGTYLQRGYSPEAAAAALMQRAPR